MKPPAQTLLVRTARFVARALISRSFWTVVDDDLQGEMATLEEQGRRRWWLSFWGAAQYLTVALRLGLEQIAWHWPRWHSLRGGWGLDFNQACRLIRRQPGHSLSVIGTIAIAIGATAAVYSVVDGVLLEPLPYPEPDRLVRVWQTRAESWNIPGGPAADRLPTNAPIYFDWRRDWRRDGQGDGQLGFEALGAYGDAGFIWRSDKGAVVIKGQEADAGFFAALGIKPLLGRWISAEDDVRERPDVVVLSESLWRTSFGGRRDVLGSSIVLNRRPHEIIGVMPERFEAPVDPTSSGLLAQQEPVLWTPLTREAKRGHKSVAVLARLEAGQTRDIVQSRFQAAHAQLVLGHGEWQRGNGVRLEGLLESVVGDVRSTLFFLLGAVGLVMLVATVNITNLLAARSLARSRELAVRSAMGAGTARLVRGRIVESALLAGLGGLIGFAMAWGLLPVLLHYLPPSVPRQETIELNVRVLLVTCALTGATALLVAALPSLLAARVDPQKALGSSARSTAGTRGVGRLRSTLVVAEVAVACVLLIGAGLLLSSFGRLWSVDRGFPTDGLVGLYIVPGADAETEALLDREALQRFQSQLRSALDALPGVRASAVNSLPLSGRGSGTTVYVRGAGSTPAASVREASAQITVGLDNAMEVIGVRLWAGRSFDPGDVAGAPPVAIINRAMADTHWPGGDAIGQHLSLFDNPEIEREIVGIAENVRHQSLAHEATPEVYLPAAQSDRVTREWVLRVDGDVGAAIDRARRLIAATAPSAAVARVLVLDEAIHASVALPRFRSFLVAGLASLAGLLALLGVYGVLSYSVAQQRHEIGVRKALGAGAVRVMTAIIGPGLRLVLAGLAIGLLVAWALADVIEVFVFEIAPDDPRIYLMVTLAVLLVGLLAALVPARRAASVSPIEILDR